MLVWISTVNAIPSSNTGPFKNHKGVVVNVLTYAPDSATAIENITQSLKAYFLQVELIDDLEVFQDHQSSQTKNLHKLAIKSKKNFTTEFDIFYTYDE